MAKKKLYGPVIEKIFLDKYRRGMTSIPFNRSEIEDTAAALGLPRPKNLGDVLYSFRFRARLPEEILKRATKGKHWVIVGEGDARYRFELAKIAKIGPRDNLEAVKIPVATPEIVSKYTRSEEQALLAVVRYNRLVDLFLGVTAYSLQSHLRTKVAGVGQIEIDELYVGISKSGAQFIIPVQAKGGNDRQGVSQVLQDAKFCRDEFPNLVPRLIAAQFLDDNRVAMLELVVSGSGAKVRAERHYHLVPADSISDTDLASYKVAEGN